MPSLKQLNCSLELGPTNTELKEYNATYTDGGVEAYICAPETDVPFHIHLTSSGYIAPGLAAYVWIDGRYQCNRNRQNIPVPVLGMKPEEYEVNFNLRQQEERTAEGHYIGRSWTFAKLQAANAGSTPSPDPRFAKNVGTIEVIVLRCKDASTQLSLADTRSYIAPPGPAPPPSHRASLPATTPYQKPTSGKKPPSKAPTKAPSKKASAAGDDMMGGLFGIFDGAGDEPDRPFRVPGRFVDQTPIAGYRWDTRSGVYRYHQGDDPFIDRRNGGRTGERSRPLYERDRHEQRAFTVHGGHTFDRRPPSLAPMRPTTAEGRYGAPMSPAESCYNFLQGRRIPLERPLNSPAQSFRSRVGDRDPPGDFSFILDLCRQIKQIYRSQYEAQKKAQELHEESEMYRNDPDLYLAAVKALRVKQAQVQSFGEEEAALFAAIFSRMRRMDRDSWHYTRDYLVVELRLVNPAHPELREWQDPRFRSFEQPRSGAGAPTSRQPNDCWQELGEGQTGVPLWQKKQQEQANGRRDSRADKPASAQGNNNAWGAAVDDIDKGAQAKDPWSTGGQDNQDQAAITWGDDGNKPDRKTGQGVNNDSWSAQGNDQKPDADWGNEKQKYGNQQDNDNNADWDDNKEDSKQGDGWPGGSIKASNKTASAKPGDWGNDASKKQPSARVDDAWGADGGGQQNGGWGAEQNDGSKKNEQGGWSNDAKSQGHNSKVNGWNDGGASKARPSGNHAAAPYGRQGGGQVSTIRRYGPVIKSYWAEVDRPYEPLLKPIPRVRDAYQYPAPPRPMAPSGKASEVSFGVAAGRGANYTHTLFRPEFLDTFEKPYAVFTFKYRSKAALEKILNRKIDTSEVQKAVRDAEKDKLLHMPKDELVQQMMKMKLAGGARSSAGPATGKVPSKSLSTKLGGDQANDELEPDQSASQGAWGAAEQGGNGGGGWAADEPRSRKTQKVASIKQVPDAAWSADDNKKSKSAANINNAWENAPSQQKRKSASRKSNKDQAKGGWNNGPGDADGWQEDKKSKTEEHFAGDPAVQQTQDAAQDNGAWGAAW